MYPWSGYYGVRVVSVVMLQPLMVVTRTWFEE